ncbi:unnamed protein product, partial [Mesorhabditis belari]|uniref:Uncharacterized protein n=1 Tax=Mesorhabditis belari TaxID=2138241 RepID=A0AAF3FHE7_9BILA
ASKAKACYSSCYQEISSKVSPLKTFQRLTPTASQKSTKGSSIFKLKSQSIKVKKDEGLPEIIKAKKPVNKQNSAGMLDLQITPKKSRHGDQTQPKKQSDAILQKQSIINIELISGAPRSMES